MASQTQRPKEPHIGSDPQGRKKRPASPDGPSHCDEGRKMSGPSKRRAVMSGQQELKPEGISHGASLGEEPQDDNSHGGVVDDEEVNPADHHDAVLDSDGEEEDLDNKDMRSFKAVKDAITSLEGKIQDSEQQMSALEFTADVQEWLFSGKDLMQINKPYDLMSAQEKAVNDLYDAQNVLEKLKVQLEHERAVLRGLNITIAGNATALDVNKGVYDATYTLEEALRRETPLCEGKLMSTVGTFVRPTPVMRDTQIALMSEGDPNWNPEWLSLNSPEFDLDRFVSKLQVAKANLANLSNTAPEGMRRTAKREVEYNSNAVRQIRAIKRYFEDGYTIHPNQIVSPKQLPEEGLCKRWLLYSISLNLRQLLAIRDRNKEIGLCMSPLDFLRWRISVICHKHRHHDPDNKNYKSKDKNICSCFSRIDWPASDREFPRDEIFRQAVLRGAKLNNIEHMFNQTGKPRKHTSRSKKKQKGAENGSTAEAEPCAASPVRARQQKDDEDAAVEEQATGAETGVDAELTGVVGHIDSLVVDDEEDEKLFVSD